MGHLVLPPSIAAHDFAALYKQEHNPRTKIRLLALSYLQAGKRIQETAALLHVERHVIGKWLKRFTTEGLVGLVGKVSSGAKPKLTKAQEQALVAHIQLTLESHPGGRLTGPKLQRWLTEQWSIEYSLAGIYVLLHRLKLAWITARPRHVKADEAQQQAFKKTC